MTIFGLNSPELFLILVIALIILGTKRIEKALNLLSKLLKFLLNNKSNLDEIDKNKQLRKETKEILAKEEKITKVEEKTHSKEKELAKEMEENQAKEGKPEKRIRIANLDKKEKKSIKIKDLKGIARDKAEKISKTKNPKRILKDKTVKNLKTINDQEEQLENK